MITMTKPTFFIADLHLNPAQPHLTALFTQFMQQQAPQAQAVYILGDLFDFWIGDDEQSELIEQVKCQIKQLTEQGVPCYFIHGNRDFLLGERFAKACQLQLLPEYYVIDLYGKKTLLCHGDTLCIDDISYQKFRQRVQQKWLQRLFLCLPLSLRLHIAHKIRQKSQQDKQYKNRQIMDVNPEYVLKILQQFKVEQVIHGHTHRQNIHQIPPHFCRIVLGDWGKTASILMADEKSIKFLPQ
ncbi:UDP-2,3-diacylglucosamine hydrolase [Volucribacter psittacicida]|uniref:UDP-2,3-diacylglucosamine hydrolase n=2 Tax=Volucribacter psittacicida TaxID=203482 RepID=A0A4R1G782_9PAST|nr:UDP-2,3-diacylglucosamine hydrolase [Volucribacter psittacicida]